MVFHEEQTRVLVIHHSDLAKPYLATQCTDSVVFCTPEALILPKWGDALDIGDQIVAIVMLAIKVAKVLFGSKYQRKNLLGSSCQD